MKKLLLILLVALCLAMVGAMVANAADVKLGWDANNPAPEGYRLFVREISEQYNYDDRSWQVPADTTTITVTGLVEGKTYAFVVRAYVGLNTSGDSNEVVYTPMAPPEQIVIPQRVGGIKIIFE